MNGMLDKDFFETRGKYITVVSPYNIMCVVKMVIEHYDTPEYDNTLFCLNNLMDSDRMFMDINQFNCNRKIYYYLEHGNSSWIHRTPGYKEFISENFDEIWSFEDNVNGLDNIMKFRIMPMRYTHLDGNKIQLDTYTSDLGFVGISCYEWAPFRGEFFHKYTEEYKDKFSFKLLNGASMDRFQKELSSCKFVLDMPRVDGFGQNQVRIFECICRGYHVLVKKNDINYFPGLVTEWETMDELNELIHTVEPQDFSKKYKEMTYTDEAFNNYKNNFAHICK